MSELPLIAHIVYRFDIGGLENGVVNLINHMPRDRYRHCIICLSDYTDFYQRIKHPVPIYALHKKAGKDFPVYFKLWKLLKKIKPDIVHTRNLSTLECQMSALCAGITARVHGEHGWDMRDLDGKNKKSQSLRRVFVPFVKHYIPLSKHSERYLLNSIHVPKHKISQLYNGVDLERFKKRDTVYTGLPPSFKPGENFIVGCVGRIAAVKNHAFLAEGFINLCQQSPEHRKKLRLIIVGDGPYKCQLEKQLHEAGLEGHVWLPGNRDDVADIMSCFDVFVLPSLAEGICNTILEAMATGIPTIATEVGGNSELLEPGITGTLIPSNDVNALQQAVNTYIDQSKQRHQHGQAARKAAEKRFSLDKMVADYLTVYDKVFTNIKVQKCVE